MEAETWHLPEYRCLAPSLQPVTEPHWLRGPRCKFEQRFLYGNGPAQVGLGSFEPHRLYIKTERSVPATHANVEHRTPNIEHRIKYSVFLIMTERSESTICHYSLFISHSLKFHTSGGLRLKDSRSDQIEETFGDRFGNRSMLGFAFRNNTGKM